MSAPLSKVTSLRAAIVATLPHLARDPDKLMVYIEGGSIRCHGTGNLSFEVVNRIKLIVIELAEDKALLFVALVAWARINAPHLLAPGATLASFDADILDNQTADFEIDIEVSDRVHVTERADGGFDMRYLAEPDPLFPDETFASLGLPAATDLEKLFGHGPADDIGKILPDTQPLDEAPLA